MGRIIGRPDKAARDILLALRNPEVKGLLFFAGILILGGTVFYMSIEGWDFVEALYFSVATLTTVGYGDLYPTSDVSRLFTAGYILLGIGFILSLVMVVARQANQAIVGRLNRRDQDGRGPT